MQERFNVHDDYSLSPSRKKDGIEYPVSRFDSIAEHLSPSRKEDGIEYPMSKFIASCMAELFVLFICGEDVYRRSLMVLTQDKTL